MDEIVIVTIEEEVVAEENIQMQSLSNPNKKKKKNHNKNMNIKEKYGDLAAK